jgi:hypothetical protein
MQQDPTTDGKWGAANTIRKVLVMVYWGEQQTQEETLVHLNNMEAAVTVQLVEWTGF